MATKEVTAYDANGEVLRFTLSSNLQRFWVNASDKQRQMRPIRGSDYDIAAKWRNLKGVHRVVVRTPLGLE